MAGVDTATGVLDGAAGVAGMVPGYGSIISGALTGVSALTKMIAAKNQKSQADIAHRNALATKKAPIRPEFLQKKRMDINAFLAGKPGMETAKTMLDESTANNLEAIRQYSPNGASTLAAISAALGGQNKAVNELSMADATYKADKLADVGATVWNLGEQERAQEAIRDQKIQQGLSYESQLRDAAMLNKQNAIDTAVGAASSTATGLAGAFGNKQKSISDASKDTAMPTQLSGASSIASAVAGGGFGSPQASAKAQELMAAGFTGQALIDELKRLGFIK